jgi:DNA-binding NtrC family response regulator
LLNGRVLFVDDEESLALLGGDLLEEFGFQVTCAFSGEGALQLFKEDPDTFSVVVTDESMPGMSGIELAQEIYGCSPSTPVIICSGHMLSMQESGMEKTNIVGILAKTAVCTELPGMLQKIFTTAG